MYIDNLNWKMFELLTALFFCLLKIISGNQFTIFTIKLIFSSFGWEFMDTLLLDSVHKQYRFGIETTYITV